MQWSFILLFYLFLPLLIGYYWIQYVYLTIDENRFKLKKVKFLCLIAAPEGIKRVEEAYPDVQIYCASIDDHLNEDCYIVPGLGDAGDRIFGIK